MAQPKLETIREIQTAIKGSNKILASRVRSWLRHRSLKVLDAVTSLIMEQSWRVDPPLSMEETCSAVQEYYRQCLIQNLDTEYAPNRSIAGLELVGWFRALWRDPVVPRQYLVRLKTMLFDLCVQNKVPQDQMAGAVLEHLFEVPEIQDFFAEWKCDPRLSEAFRLAKEWGNDHLAKSP